MPEYTRTSRGGGDANVTALTQVTGGRSSAIQNGACKVSLG